MPKAVPSLVIRPHDPARARLGWLVLAVAWLASVLVAVVVMDVLTSGPRSASEKTLLAAAEAENASLKAQAAVLSRSEQVARNALSAVQQTLRERDEEVAALRADLAFYGRLVGSARREGLTVHRLALAPVAGADAWNFTVTLTQNFKRGQDIHGRVSLAVEGVRGGKLATLEWPELSQSGTGIEYEFKYFQQVKGTIMLPEGFMPNRVVVHADGDGGRVEQAFSWQDATRSEEGEDVRQ